MTMNIERTDRYRWYPELSEDSMELNQLNLTRTARQPLKYCANYPNADQAGTFFRPCKTYARILETDPNKVEVVFFQYTRFFFVMGQNIIPSWIPDLHRIIVDIPAYSIREVNTLDIFKLVSNDWSRGHLRQLFIDPLLSNGRISQGSSTKKDKLTKIAANG